MLVQIWGHWARSETIYSDSVSFDTFLTTKESILSGPLNFLVP
jgi:hypothetical protein